MLIGSDLIAKALKQLFAADPCTLVYAAGVSNSNCTDPREFARDRERLCLTLRSAMHYQTLIYFGTTSVNDPDSSGNAYVTHKLEMEAIVKQHPGFLIWRLPQIAGRTPNPHTLLNYIFSRIARGERFALWSRARRNIIDIEDLGRLAPLLVKNRLKLERTLDVANPRDYSVKEIVIAFERLLGKSAIYDEIDRGGSCAVRVHEIQHLFEQAGINFDGNYLEQVLRKYYG